MTRGPQKPSLDAANANQPDPWNELGLVELRAGRPQEAAAAFRQAIARQPGFFQAWRNLGDALTACDRIEEAIAVYEQTLSIRPDDVETYNNLGIALQSAGRLDEAIEALRSAVAIDSRAYQPRCNLGNALLKNGKTDEALTELRHAVALEPRNAEVRNGLGAALEASGQFIDSVAEFKEAVSLDPNFARAHYNLGLALLRQGEFDTGWREYEWRWRLGGKHLDRREFAQPRWTGEPLGDRRLLIHAEQGLGDAIQFVRYLPLINPQFGGRVILAVHPELRRLFSQIDGIDQVWTDAKLPEFEMHCPLLSLPMLFKTTLATIPAAVPYLSADSMLAAKWSDRLHSIGGARKVGIAWAGRADHTRDRERSLHPKTILSLGDVKDVSWISLQKEPAAKPDGALAEKMRLIDWTEEIQDFADTAAIIDQLDLVITVDTAVAHLAGAMGKPVWVLLPYVPDWRWMLSREDSPWYPTMRLFRQSRLGDWTGPIERIGRELNSI